jgi:hypothetical protein
MHIPGAVLPAVFRPFFGDERAAHRPLAADADSGEQTEDGELPDVGHDPA